MKASHCYDVVIVGAGASGLSCAATLRKQNVDLLVLEARDRMGGRVFSKQSQQHALPIELGAEFIHAASPLLLGLLEQTGHDFYDVKFDQQYLKNGKLVRLKDFWERFDKVLSMAQPHRKVDRSMAEFMTAHKQALSAEMTGFLKGYVEGFQAADLDLIGERAFAQSEGEKRDLNGNNDFRPLVAYIDILKQLLKGTDLKKHIRLNHAVHKITQFKNYVEIESTLASGRKSTIRTRKVVVSVPIGVLRGDHPSSRIEFSPELPELYHGIRHLHMGHVQRMLLIFKNRFWESLSEDDPVSFLRASPEHYYPTWWTLSPLRAPYLLAWQGGPKALEMSHWSQQKRIDQALSTLSKLTQRPVKFLRQELESTHEHNWSQDPFTLGGYSYTGVIPVEMKRPAPTHFKNFLWLTGEAFAKADGQGTVHGALEHGQETAKKILKSGI